MGHGSTLTGNPVAPAPRVIASVASAALSDPLKLAGARQIRVTPFAYIVSATVSRPVCAPRESETRGGTASPSALPDGIRTRSQLLLDLEAMLIVSPAPHVGFTLGPTFDYELSRSAETDGEDTLEGVSTSFTDVGLQAGFVAWL